MDSEEIIVQVMLKPNCGLENTRASLVVRRIAPLCSAICCHPRTVKSDPRTIDFLRDHGLFIRFSSSTPEQVLTAIKGCFFVDRWAIVDDPSRVPPYDATAIEEESAEGELSAFALSASFGGNNESDERISELTRLLERFEESHRALRAHSERTAHDSKLSSIVFAHAQAVDGLRSAVARSRVEPFSKIAPSLRTLAADYGQRFGVSVDIKIIDDHMALDRSVLASIEEILKRVLRSCIRDGIGSPEERIAAGKPARATVQLHLESDGPDAVCRIEHDGYPFSARVVGQEADKRGLLTRPLETYTDEEIGALLLLPGFMSAEAGCVSDSFSQFNEVGAMLQRIGGRGEVRNTERGTLEIALHVPVPFTVMEAALVHTGESLFALPAQQIKHFEAFRQARVEREEDRIWYTVDDGERIELLNGEASGSPFAPCAPTLAILLEARGQQRVLIADGVDGYERITMSQIPALLDRRELRRTGCFGYTMLENGTPCAVVSIRHLLNAADEEWRNRA